MLMPRQDYYASRGYAERPDVMMLAATRRRCLRMPPMCRRCSARAEAVVIYACAVGGARVIGGAECWQ